MTVYCGVMEYTREAAERLRGSAQYKRLRAALIGADSLCEACGSDEFLQADHRVPLSVGMSRGLDPSNLRVLCRGCNLARNRYRLDVDASDVSVRRQW